MGLRVGEMNGGLRALFPAGVSRAGMGRSAPPIGFGQPEEDGVNALFQRDKKAEVPSVGFGQNTVSGPGAAFRALDRGLTSARRIVPTVEELRATQRDRQAARRAEQAQERPREMAREVRPTAFDPVENARGFLEGINQAATRAQARFGGEVPAVRSGPTIQVGTQTIGFVGGAEDTEAVPQFDVSV